jgi:aspartate kinase
MVLVLKFGGTSVADVNKIRNVAKIVASYINSGKKIVVVVSAMAGVTNTLVEYVNSFDKASDNLDEYDVVVSSGEQVTVGLMVLALKEIGINARSFLGWQIPITTDLHYGVAKINKIKTNFLLNSLKYNIIPVVAGFQGISSENKVTTLGRGGSDTSAVAIANVLKAEACYIYTDVDGVYTADPKIVKNARKLKTVSFEEMLELANLGAKVLQTRSVELAMNNKVKLYVLSSFENVEGTYIVDRKEDMEQSLIKGIVLIKNQVLVTLQKLNSMDDLSCLLLEIAKARIDIDMVQTIFNDINGVNVYFSISINDEKKFNSMIQKLKNIIKYEKISFTRDVSKLSLVGVGIKDNSDILQKVFNVVKINNSVIYGISKTEIKISMIVDSVNVDKLANDLHDSCNLGDSNVKVGM